jgi:hypothetical protein
MATPGSTKRLRALSAPTMAILGVAWQETFHGTDVFGEYCRLHKQERRPSLGPRRRFAGG